MEIYVQKSGRSLELEHDGSAATLLELLGISPEVVLIVRDGELITAEDSLAGARRVELLSVISGG